MAEITPPALSAVQDARLKVLSEAGNGTHITAKTIWQAVLCRAEAKRVWEEQRPQLQALGVRLACLVHEALRAEIAGFYPEYWGGDLFLDEDKAFYKSLNSGQVRRGSLLEFLNPWSKVWAHAKEAKKTIKESNLKGDGLTMGGSMVFRAGDKGIEYAYAEHVFGDHAEPAALLAACTAAKEHS